MATIEESRVFEYCEQLFMKLKEQDGGYYPSKHDELVISETAKKFSLSPLEVDRIYDEYTKQSADIEIKKINKLPLPLRKKVMLQYGADIIKENKDLPFYISEGAPSKPLPRHGDILYDDLSDLTEQIAKAGWTIPLSIDIKRFDELKSIANDKKKLDDFFIKYYNGKEFKLICRKISKAIESYNCGRKNVFLECVDAYENHLYSACATTLVATLDGFISTFGDNPKNVKMMRICNFNAKKERDSKKDIKSLCWLSMYEYVKMVFAPSDFDKDEPETINRHWLEHGRTQKVNTQIDCLKLFNAFSTLTIIKQSE